jgi:hypothetical protein
LEGRSLASELRAAAEISLVTRAVYLLRSDPETRQQLGDRVTERQRQAEEALDRLCVKLFGRGAAVEELLAVDFGLERPTLHPTSTNDHEAAANGPVGKVGTPDAQSTV